MSPYLLHVLGHGNAVAFARHARRDRYQAIIHNRYRAFGPVGLYCGDWAVVY